MPTVHWHCFQVVSRPAVVFARDFLRCRTTCCGSATTLNGDACGDRRSEGTAPGDPRRFSSRAALLWDARPAKADMLTVWSLSWRRRTAPGAFTRPRCPLQANSDVQTGQCLALESRPQSVRRRRSPEGLAVFLADVELTRCKHVSGLHHAWAISPHLISSADRPIDHDRSDSE